MKLTLRLYFTFANKTEQVVAERVWADITSGNNPFWKEVHRSKPTGGHFAFPDYPHTGDQHTFYLQRSGYRVVFTARTETGGVVTIHGTDVSITTKTTNAPVLLHFHELFALMRDEGWGMV